MSACKTNACNKQRNCSQWMNQQFSPDDDSKITSLTEGLAAKIKLLAMIVAGAAVVSIIAGVLIIAFGWMGGYPMTSGVQIWSAAIMLGGAGCGIYASFVRPEEKGLNPKSSKQARIACQFPRICMFSMWSLAFNIGCSSWALGMCVQKDSSNKKCPENHDLLIAMNAVAIAMVVIIVITVVYSYKILCNYNKDLHQIKPISTNNVLTPPTYSDAMSTSKY